MTKYAENYVSAPNESETSEVFTSLMTSQEGNFGGASMTGNNDVISAADDVGAKPVARETNASFDDAHSACSNVLSISTSSSLSLPSQSSSPSPSSSSSPPSCLTSVPPTSVTGSNSSLTEVVSPSSFVTSSDDAIGQSNLIVNYLPAFMSQDDVRALFESMGQLESCKLVRDKNTGHSLGYGFVKFKSKEAARKALKTFNGLRIQNKTIKVSYARPSSDVIKGANLYVSGLPVEVNPNDLTELFKKYGNIISIRILSDSQTGLSKGVAFIRFDLRSEAEAAVNDLNGSVVFGVPITVKFASQPVVSPEIRPSHVSTASNRTFVHHPYLSGKLSKLTNNGKIQSKVCLSGECTEDSSWALHVNNLPPDTVDSDVWSLFGPMGTVKSVKVMRDKVTGNCKGHAFVNMPDLDQARTAVSLLNGIRTTAGNIIQVQLKGLRAKVQKSLPTMQPQQHGQFQQDNNTRQQLFLQRPELTFSGTNAALQQMQHLPVIFQQNNNDAQQHPIHLQQNFQLPTQIALHSAVATSLPNAILTHPTFYPTVIDPNLLTGLNGVQSQDLSNSGIILSSPTGSIMTPNQLSKLSTTAATSATHTFSHSALVNGSFPIAIIHDL